MWLPECPWWEPFSSCKSKELHQKQAAQKNRSPWTPGPRSECFGVGREHRQPSCQGGEVWWPSSSDTHQPRPPMGKATQTAQKWQVKGWFPHQAWVAVNKFSAEEGEKKEKRKNCVFFCFLFFSLLLFLHAQNRGCLLPSSRKWFLFSQKVWQIY